MTYFIRQSAAGILNTDVQFIFFSARTHANVSSLIYFLFLFSSSSLFASCRLDNMAGPSEELLRQRILRKNSISGLSKVLFLIWSRRLSSDRTFQCKARWFRSHCCLIPVSYFVPLVLLGYKGRCACSMRIW